MMLAEAIGLEPGRAKQLEACDEQGSDITSRWGSTPWGALGEDVTGLLTPLTTG